jgi:hypothetical protein
MTKTEALLGVLLPGGLTVEVVDVVDVVVARFRVCTLLIDVDAFLDLLRSLHFDEKVK